VHVKDHENALPARSWPLHRIPKGLGQTSGISAQVTDA
jgi:hypothetical protein